MSIPQDVREFLDGYPEVEDDHSYSANLDFYSNRLRCKPDNLLIDEIHDQWFGDYDKLEYKHGYIQWLFPIREIGMNYRSEPLQPHEIQSMRADPVIVQRILRSYELMLDFYGMRLLSVESGLIGRSRNYAARYQNLVRASHNNLRISRILKCLSEFGLEHLNAGFLLHILNEQSEYKALNSTGICSSMKRWWANCIRIEQERVWIGNTIRKACSGTGGYVFTQKLYKDALDRRMTTGSFGS